MADIPSGMLRSATQTGLNSLSDIRKLYQSIFDATVLSRADPSLKPTAWFDLGGVCFRLSFHWRGIRERVSAFPRGDGIVHRSLKHASRLWKAMLEGRDTRELRKTYQIFEEMGFTE